MASVISVPNSKTSVVDVSTGVCTRVWYLYFNDVFNLLKGGNTGTWTPVLTGSVSNPSVVYTQQVGEYVKVGGITQCNGYVAWSSYSGGSGTVRVSLPYVVANTVGVGGVVSSSNGISFPALGSFLTVEGVNNTSYCKIVGVYNGTSSVDVTFSELSGSGYFRFNIVYSS